MKSTIGHIYLYASNLKKSYAFYKPLLEYLGYRENAKFDWGFAFINNGTSIWFEQTPKDYLKDGYHRKRVGLNHLAFKLESKEEVDKFYKEFLRPQKIKTLYDSPKSYPEYEEGYYAVYFEDPERMKIEVVSHP